MDPQTIEYRNEPSHIHVPRPSYESALPAAVVLAGSADAVADPCSGPDNVAALGEVR